MQVTVLRNYQNGELPRTFSIYLYSNDTNRNNVRKWSLIGRQRRPTYMPINITRLSYSAAVRSYVHTYKVVSFRIYEYIAKFCRKFYPFYRAMH